MAALRIEDTKKIVVVCESPQNFAAAMRKEWGRGIDETRRKLAASKGGTEAMLLESDIAIMESITFAAAPPLDLEADVIFATVSDLKTQPPKCDVLVIVAPLGEEIINHIAHNMRKNRQIVMYG